MEFARLSIEGMPVSKRKIKPLIDKGLVSGFDDIRLPTLRGLQKRGILPEAIKQFVISQGISKMESTVSFSLVEAANRKILDPIAKRYFFVENPIKLTVDKAPIKTKKINLHPTNKDLGTRDIKTSKTFFVQKKDIEKLKEGDVFRLKDLYNVKIKQKNDHITGEYAGDNLIDGSMKIQWTTEKHVETTVFIPHFLFIEDKYNPDSLEETNGFAEEDVTGIKNGEIIQFERFGFVRIENNSGRIIVYFAHK